jgi:two-component system, OmpR family, sensor histidine kinase MprB
MAVAASAAVALTVVGLAAGDYTATRSTLRDQINNQLTEQARRLTAHASRHSHATTRHARPVTNVVTSAPFGGAEGSVQFISPTGKVTRPVTDAASVLPVDQRVDAIAKLGRGSFFSDMRVQGIHLRVLTVARGSRGAVQIALPLTEVDDSLHRLLIVMLLMGAGGVLIAAVLGAVVARTALAPVAQFTSRTETLAANPDLSQRLDVVGKDELTRLARAFNATLDTLEHSVEAQRHLVADASHELRTPLASLRTNIQTLEEAEQLPNHERESLRADIIGELDELTALVEDVVELARGTSPSEFVDDIRLDHIVSDLIRGMERRTAGAITIQTRLEPTVVRGEQERIARAVSNLLDNARKWSPDGAAIDVELHAATLTVRDHGPGFAERDLPHVFDRFYRADSARGMPGSGLGLAIVRHAAEAHGGYAEAANAPGGGAIIRVRFGPASKSSTPSDERDTSEPGGLSSFQLTHAQRPRTPPQDQSALT